MNIFRKIIVYLEKPSVSDMIPTVKRKRRRRKNLSPKSRRKKRNLVGFRKFFFILVVYARKFESILIQLFQVLLGIFTQLNDYQIQSLRTFRIK